MENKITIQKLNGSNYFMWKFKVELILQRDKLWTIVNQEPPTPILEEWTIRDQAARATICLSIEDKLLINVRHCTTAKNTWKTISRIYEHSSLSSKLHLRRKLYGTRYNNQANMRDFINSVLETVGELRDLGENTNDQSIIAIMLCGLPHEYDSLITAIESKDEKDLTLEYVTVKLLDEAARREQEIDIPETLAMPTSRGPLGRDRSYTCYGCGQTGHTRRDCPKENRRSEQRKYPQPQRQPTWENGENKSSKNFMTSVTEDNIYQENAIDHNFSNINLSDNEIDEHRPESQYTALSGTLQCKTKQWILDSGASNHMTYDKNFFQEITYLKQPIPITLADGNEVFAEGKGKGLITVDNDIKQGDVVCIHDVLFVPSLKFQLISIRQLCGRGHQVKFNNNKCYVINDNKNIAIATLKEGTFILKDQKTTENHTLNSCIHTWHQRLGHRSLKNINYMKNHNSTKDMIIDKCEHSDFCDICQLNKMKQRPFLTSNENVPKPFHTIVTDLCGPMPDESLGGNRYVLTITDKFSRYTHVDMLKYKSQSSEKIMTYIQKGKNQFGHYPSILRSDGGGEFNNKELDDYLNKCGTIHQLSLPYTPQQNGNSERLNSTLLSTTRCLLKQGKLPNKLWGEAMNTASYIINRSVHSATGKTPYEMWTGKLPTNGHLRVFGCRAFGYKPLMRRGKFDTTATEGIFVGYGINTKGYRLWIPGTNSVITTSKMTFDESTFKPCATVEDHEMEFYHMSDNSNPDTVNEGLRRSPRQNKGVPPVKLTY